MFIPYSTDAPIYHWPRATVGLIAADVLIHVGRELAPQAAEPFALALGEGLHPVQWLTNNYLHADVLHLLGNMLFLWAYGIIVEGKVGWWAMLLLYNVIGLAYGASVQLAYLGAEEPGLVLGASAAIFGLMAICMVWAPRNELSCFYLFFVGVRLFTGTVEWPIWGFALLQLALEGLGVGVSVLLKGDPMSSAFLHVSGAFWGLVVGLGMLKLRWVDCEGWDVFSLRDKRKGLAQAWREREVRLDRARERDRLPRAMAGEIDRPEASLEERAARRLAKLRRVIAEDDPASIEPALRAWLGQGTPSRDDLIQVIRALHEREAWSESVPALRAFCRLYPEGAAKARLRLAQILLRDLNRPTEAARQLDLAAEGELDPKLVAARRRMRAEAAQRIEEGVLEVEEE
jgi:membrane associated rhomboid family serine protease